MKCLQCLTENDVSATKCSICEHAFAPQQVKSARYTSFYAEYARYMKADPDNPDRKRKALCAVAAKVARVAHGLIKTGTDYRPYFEAPLPVEHSVRAGRRGRC